jgi:23S rRNA (cytidine2498-2'-O)-methyltransferase
VIGRPLGGALYLPAADFAADLEAELGADAEVYGPGYFAAGPLRPAYWARNIWLDPFVLEFASIGEAAAALRSVQRNWAPSLFGHFRRGALIAAKLPPLSAKPRTFPWRLPDAPMGAFSLLDEHTLIGSAACSSPFPDGLFNLAEDKVGPPSRAYRKLQEALIRARAWPKPGQVCLDAGAAPGGWTWVLAGLGAEVVAVDRAPLENGLAERENVRYLKHDAFTLRPEEIGKVDWLCSDVICYPPRLYEWIERWLASGLCRNFVCTIKMQGEADRATTARFAAVPGSSVVHLDNNKHELTWLRIDPVECDN